MKPYSKDVATDFAVLFPTAFAMSVTWQISISGSAGSWMTSLALLWEMMALQVGHEIRTGETSPRRMGGFERYIPGLNWHWSKFDEIRTYPHDFFWI